MNLFLYCGQENFASGIQDIFLNQIPLLQEWRTKKKRFKKHPSLYIAFTLIGNADDEYKSADIEKSQKGLCRFIVCVHP